MNERFPMDVMARRRRSSKKKFTVSHLRSLYWSLLNEIKFDNEMEGMESTPSSNPEQQSNTRIETTNNISKKEMKRLKRQRKQLSETSVATAWRVLSAFMSPDKKNSDILAERDDMSIKALGWARSLEGRIVETIRCIGEVVVYGEQHSHLSGAAVIFEYFCDKNIVALLVDIAKSKPVWLSQMNGGMMYSSVACTALVKSQIMQTVSILFSNVQDPTSLYYLLSNNHVNELVLSLIPLDQFTEEALEEIMPVYISFLKTLALQLAAFPPLMQFFLYSCKGDDGNKSPSFPLFSAAVEVATSAYATSDSFVHLTSLNIILNLCRIGSDPVRVAIANSIPDQRRLFAHSCRNLLSRYTKLVRLTQGRDSNIDDEDGTKRRSNAVSYGILEVQEQLSFLNDLLRCGVRPLNVRLCEYLLHHVFFTPILEYITLDELKNRQTDTTKPVPLEEKVSEHEAKLLVSMHFLSQFFLIVEYTPLLRMVAVAVLHPLSPSKKIIASTASPPKKESSSYTLTTALHHIVQNHSSIRDTISLDDEDSSTDHGIAKPNPYRRVLLDILRGDAGDRAFLPAAMLLQSIIESKAVDFRSLQTLRVIPAVSPNNDESAENNSVEGHDVTASPFEQALATFFQRTHASSSPVSTFAMELAGALVLSLISAITTAYYYHSNAATSSYDPLQHLRSWILSSSLIRSLIQMKSRYASQTLQFLRDATSDVSVIFVELVEMEVFRQYSPTPNGTKDSTNHHPPSSPSTTTSFSLIRFNATHLKNNPQVLVRNRCDTTPNEVEDARFVVRVTLYLRSLCDVVQEMLYNVVSDMIQETVGTSSSSLSSNEDYDLPPSQTTKNLPEKNGLTAIRCRTTDEADNDLILIGGLKKYPIGAELDLRGRTFFYFSPESHKPQDNQDDDDMSPAMSSMIRLATLQKELVLVVDPTELHVIIPYSWKGGGDERSYRGRILCSVPFQGVIAAATDGYWLHVALRQVEDNGLVIKNGNMAFRFETTGMCLIAHQHLERYRSSLRSRLLSRIESLFEKCMLSKIHPILLHPQGVEPIFVDSDKNASPEDDNFSIDNDDEEMNMDICSITLQQSIINLKSATLEV